MKVLGLLMLMIVLIAFAANAQNSDPPECVGRVLNLTDCFMAVVSLAG